MSEVEFLVPQAADDVVDGTDELVDLEPPAGLFRRHLSTTVATALWAAAAVLSLLAPFRTLYTRPFDGGLDGWGRVLVESGGFGTPSHGPRFGVPIVAGGAVCALLAAWIAVQAWRGVPVAPRITGLLLPALGLLAGGVILGSTASAWAYYDALQAASAQEDRIRVLDDGSVASSGVDAVHPGAFWVLAILAGACALLGALASAAPSPPASEAVAEPLLEDAPPEPAPPDAGPTVVADPVVRIDGDEELLGS